MVYYNTHLENLRIRDADIDDIPLILTFIKETAEYEKMADEVTATEDSLKEVIFQNQRAKVIIAEYNGHAVGYALYFFNFSTFTGKSGLYLEDIFVSPKVRGTGVGKALFIHLAKIANEMSCITMDWMCLDWNKPSLRFYESIGAKTMPQWVSLRLEEKEIDKIASIVN